MKTLFCSLIEVFRQSKRFLNSKFEIASFSFNTFIVIGLLSFSTTVFSQKATTTSKSDPITQDVESEPFYLWLNEPFGDYPQSAEDVSKRTAKSKHFVNDNGMITAHISTDDIHYEEGGELKTIFHTIFPSATGYENKTNRHKTFYPATSSGSIRTVLPNGATLIDMKGMRMYFEVNGQVSQSQNIQSKQGLVDYNELIYQNVYGAGIDLRLTQNTKQRKMDFIIQNALTNIPVGAQYLTFEEKVELPIGWTAELMNNEILLKDQAGALMAKYEKPVYKDTPPTHDHANASNETARSGQHNEYEVAGSYEIEQVSNVLTIKTKVPMSWLSSPERNYPLIIDPTIQLYPTNASLWTGTVVHNGFGGAHTSTSGDAIYLGRDGSTTIYSGWAKFDVTSLPDNACITSAALYYNVYDMLKTRL